MTTFRLTNIKSIIISFGLLTVMACSTNTNINTNNKTTSSTTDNPYQAKVDSIISLMTLDEKIGQLNLPATGPITTGASKSTGVIKKIEEGKIGGLFNIKDPKNIYEIQKIAVEKSRLKIPLIFGMDVIHGYKTTFPIPLGLSASWDMEMIEKTAQIAAMEASANGINWTFSPMVDISRDPRWGRVSEGNGEDPYLGSQIARAMVRGYQQNDLAANNTLMSCVKHFALYGAPEAGRDYNTVDMSRIRMYNEYLQPYKAAVDEGVGSVMASFNEIDGVPATGNKWLLTKLLREDWGFNGFVVSDYTGIYEMRAHGMGDEFTVTSLALKAGLDMDMAGDSPHISASFTKDLKTALERNLISVDDINKAVSRILTAKYQLGLFDDPYKYCNLERAEKETYTQENRDYARVVGAESTVLLKNDKQILPLKKSGTIAVIGPLAKAGNNMPGTWSVATDHQNAISVWDGLQQTVGTKVNLLYAKGSNITADLALEKRVTMFGKDIPRDERTDKQLLEEALSIAAQSDVIVATIGESSEYSGESSSRTDLKIPQIQKDLLQALLKTGKPVVLVLFTGRPLNLVEESETVPAILNVWFPGSEAGLSISDVLFGDVNPSGKLTATFPRNVGQVPLFYNHKNTGRPLGNNEGKFEKFKTNYLDVRNEPLYPFGYGLSYTTFEYGELKLDKTSLSKNETIKVSIDITNTGNYDGKEVAQLYIRDVVGSVTRPVKELKGFQKIFIKKGETKTVRFTISIEDLKFYNSNLDFVAEPGEFQVAIGTNSDVVLTNSFQLLD
ncbi:beta-glucosidase BglX [Kordia algicida OT-1]|uniref:Periplasmic beta-glucosidase n=1 Tax=Kordia algicida OT-1 TaxID=391587 RepID=A9ECS1_9FLAO|nr:beta-glucosidase BglX [Kordia algicida]EDP94303.1 beta-glucosidase [Kordia algicida OT-1]